MFNTALPEAEREVVYLKEFISTYTTLSDVPGTGIRNRSARESSLNSLMNKLLNGEAKIAEGKVYEKLYFSAGLEGVKKYFHLDEMLKAHQGEYFAIVIDDLPDYPFNAVQEEMHKEEMERRKQHSYFKKESFPIVLIGRIASTLTYFDTPTSSHIGFDHNDRYLYVSRGVMKAIEGQMFQSDNYLDRGEEHLWHRAMTAFLAMGSDINYLGNSTVQVDEYKNWWGIAQGVMLIVGNEAINTLSCNSQDILDALLGENADVPTLCFYKAFGVLTPMPLTSTT